MLTEYTVQVSCEPTAAKQLIHTWLLENSFEPANEDGTQYFTHRVQEEPAARSFMYEIKGNVVTLYSFYGTPLRSYSDDYFNEDYRESVKELGASLQNLHTYAPEETPLKSEIEKQDNTNRYCAYCSLLIGVLSCVLPFLGGCLGAFALFVAYTLASRGLKSDKRAFAIAGIVTTSVGTLLLLLVFVLTMIT